MGDEDGNGMRSCTITKLHGFAPTRDTSGKNGLSFSWCERPKRYTRTCFAMLTPVFRLKVDNTTRTVKKKNLEKRGLRHASGSVNQPPVLDSLPLYPPAFPRLNSHFHVKTLGKGLNSQTRNAPTSSARFLVNYLFALFLLCTWHKPIDLSIIAHSLNREEQPPYHKMGKSQEKQSRIHSREETRNM